MTYLFLRFCLLNAAEKEGKLVKQGLRIVLAVIIRFKLIVVRFEECIDDSKCSRTKSAVPFADTLIYLGHASSCKPESPLATLMRKSTYQKEYRPLSLDAIWDSGTIDNVPNLLH